MPCCIGEARVVKVVRGDLVIPFINTQLDECHWICPVALKVSKILPIQGGTAVLEGVCGRQLCSPCLGEGGGGCGVCHRRCLVLGSVLIHIGDNLGLLRWCKKGLEDAHLLGLIRWWSRGRHGALARSGPTRVACSAESPPLRGRQRGHHGTRRLQRLWQVAPSRRSWFAEAV